MNEESRNCVILIVTICGLNENDWTIHIIYFLKDNTESPELFRTDIYEERDQFTIDDDEYLLRKLTNNLSFYVSYVFRIDFIERMYSKYGHLGHLGLLEVVNDRR